MHLPAWQFIESLISAMSFHFCTAKKYVPSATASTHVRLRIGRKAVSKSTCHIPPFFPLRLKLYFSPSASLCGLCAIWCGQETAEGINCPLHRKLKNITERCKKKLKRKAATSHAGPIAFVGSRHKLAAVENQFAVLRVLISLLCSQTWNDDASCLPGVVPTAHRCRAPMLPWPAPPSHHLLVGTLYDAMGGVCHHLQLLSPPRSPCLAAGSGKVWGVAQGGPWCPEEWLQMEQSGFGMAGISATLGHQAQRDCTWQGGRVSLDLRQCSRPGWGRNPWCLCEEVVQMNVQNCSRLRKRHHCWHCRIKWNYFHLDQTVDWWVMQG